MTREEYINQILCQVKSKSARAEIEMELNEHIEDRIEYYTDAGYDYDYALKRAMEYMGEPTSVGAKLNNIHNDTPIKVASVLCQIALILSMLFSVIVEGYYEFFEFFGLKYEVLSVIHVAFIFALCVLNYFLCSKHQLYRLTLALGLEIFIYRFVYIFDDIYIFGDLTLTAEIQLGDFFDFEASLAQRLQGLVMFSADWLLFLISIILLCYGIHMKNKLKGKYQSVISQRYYNFNYIHLVEFLAISIMAIYVVINY